LTVRFLVVLTLLVVPATARADGLETFPLPVGTAASSPIAGPDGSLWFTNSAGAGRIDRTGRVATFPGPGLSGLVSGADGAFYAAISENGAFSADFARVHSDGRIERVRRPDLARKALAWLAPAPGGELWAMTSDGKEVVRMTTSGAVTARVKLRHEAIEETPAPAADGGVWFVCDGGIAHLSPTASLRFFDRDEANDGGALAIAADGGVWFAPMFGRVLIHLAPDGKAREVRLPVQPTDVVSGPDGAVWFGFATRRDGGVGRVAPDGSGRRLWRSPFGNKSWADVAFDGTGDLWRVGDHGLERLQRAAAPVIAPPMRRLFARSGDFRGGYGLAAAPDGAMWMPVKTGIMRIAPDGSHRLFTGGPTPKAHQVMPTARGGAWFAYAGRGLAQLSPDGSVRRHTRGFGRRSKIFALAPGAGKDIWFLDLADNTVGRWRPGAGVRRFDLGRGRDLLTLVRGPDRRTWVTDQAGAIFAISDRGRVSRYTRGLGGAPTAITHGPDGNLWFTMFERSRIGRITPSGRIRLWRVPDSPAAIVAGRDGGLWFSTAGRAYEEEVAGLGRIDLNGRVVRFPVRESLRSGFHSLAPGPGGAIWFVPSGGPAALGALDPGRLVEMGLLPGR
jgi:streptogramin lyase